MAETVKLRGRNEIRSLLHLKDKDLLPLLQDLKLDANAAEFSEEQFLLIRKYHHLRKKGLLERLEEKKARCDNDLARAVESLCAELGENFEDEETYSLKSLMEKVAGKINRPVKLGEMAEILEIAGLEVEEEYTAENLKAIDEALIPYLARELSRKEAGSAEGDIGTVLDRGVSGEVEGLTETIAGTVANTREGLEETFQREIPRRMLAQLAAAAQSGILGQKIEIAREKIAEQKRIAGETTIDVTIAGGENKQLKSAEVKDGKDGGKGG